MKKSVSLFVCALLLGGSALAQVVSGKVTTSDGTALPGVSVLVKGTTTGLTTDSEGRFTISVPDESSTLVFSFIGFVTQEVVVGNRSTINVEMREDLTELNEVVITALGIPRETKTLVYATQQVKPSELTEVRDANNVLNSLQGKVANAFIVQGSGGPGSGAKIVLRGTAPYRAVTMRSLWWTEYPLRTERTARLPVTSGVCRDLTEPPTSTLMILNR